MKKVKRVFDKFIDVVGVIGITTLVVAWTITGVCMTYGIAVWSFKWLMGLV